MTQFAKPADPSSAGLTEVGGDEKGKATIRARRQRSLTTTLMGKKRRQSARKAIAALPHYVYEIKAKAVLGRGKRLQVSYIGITCRSRISQRVSEHKDRKTACNIPLWHCLNNEICQEICLGKKSNEKKARAMESKHIASRKRVLNMSGTSLSGNSVYRQYLRYHKLKSKGSYRKTSRKDFEGRAKECSACGKKKEADEFYATTAGVLSSCKECFKDSVSRNMGLAEYRTCLERGKKLKPKRSVAKSKKCNCCGRRKKAKDMGRNSMCRGGLQPTCKECRNKARREGIKLAVLRRRYGNH